MTHLNLGILAHVDAGKTTLTERLLYESGVIAELGSVDKGTTQTDTLEIERRRGITIKSAVAAMSIHGVSVNLIDTPGHPDFIAEVERALSVLDGAVLVVSAVEGVQPQTRALMRALRRLMVPTLIFVNKIDRLGADDVETERQIQSRLGVTTTRMGSVLGAGSRAASVGVVEQPANDLAREVAAGLVHPLYPGSAITGAGVSLLMAGIASLLPRADADVAASLRARVFKIDRTRSGASRAYVRLYRGTLRVRDRIVTASGRTETVTGVDVFVPGGTHALGVVAAGEIGRLAGLSEMRVGDVIGEDAAGATPFRFAPPAMEAIVETADLRDGPRLRAALRQLAEQDPLIAVRIGDDGGISVSLYGDVQREVITATLALDYGVDARFRGVTPVCVERPRAVGTGLALIRDRANPWSATVGLRVEPLDAGAGVVVDVAVPSPRVPSYIYRNRQGFVDAVTDHVHRALEVGNYGWRVTDCRVTMTDCDYYVGDGVPPPGKGRSTAADFRMLVPEVLRTAVAAASTAVCEPVVRARIETSSATLGAVLGLVASVEGHVNAVMQDVELATITLTLTAAHAQVLLRQLSGASGGEGSCETEVVGFREVIGAPLTRGGSH